MTSTHVCSDDIVVVVADLPERHVGAGVALAETLERRRAALSLSDVAVLVDLGRY